MKQPINPPDSTTGDHPNTDEGKDVDVSSSANIQTFDPSGAANPPEPTKGAEIPDAPEPKRGRGRPRKDGAHPQQKKEKLSDSVQAAVLYNTLLVGVCGLLSDEYAQSEELQRSTIEAAREYFESIDMSLPPWVGLLAVTGANVAAAIKTPKGRSKIFTWFASVKAWIVKIRG